MRLVSIGAVEGPWCCERPMGGLDHTTWVCRVCEKTLDANTLQIFPAFEVKPGPVNTTSMGCSVEPLRKDP